MYLLTTSVRSVFSFGITIFEALKKVLCSQSVL